MGVTYSKPQRQRAKTEKQTLVTMAVDQSTNGYGVVFQGMVGEEERTELLAFIEGFLDRHYEKRKAERKAAAQ